MVDGFAQDPIDGVSLAYTFADATAPTRKQVQYFDNNGSRAIYQDGWVAATFGPLTAVAAGCARPCRLGFGQGRLGALQHHQGLLARPITWRRRNRSDWRSCRRPFDAQARANQVYPMGAGIWLRLHPEDRVKYTLHELAVRRDDDAHARVHGAGPGHARATTVTVDAEFGDERFRCAVRAGWSVGGLALYMDKGELVYEYNMMIIERTVARSKSKLAAGKHTIEVDTTIAKPGRFAGGRGAQRRWRGSRAHDRQAHGARGLPASETFDVGVDLGSPVSIDYFDRRPFRFDGKISSVKVKLN